jgi:hypothetical protein
MSDASTLTRALFLAAWACAVAVLWWPNPPVVSRADVVRSLGK